MDPNTEGNWVAGVTLVVVLVILGLTLWALSGGV